MHVTELYLIIYSLPVAEILYTFVKYGWIGVYVRVCVCVGGGGSFYGRHIALTQVVVKIDSVTIK